ncbi:Pupal cuticle protein [Papilio machaon]|uniref:Pupal cuticle protein n=1 Tax=Papilio machaon TaxID=76193 RepID=A0A194RSG3_PAPMA|nr:Pupal cuticle protein [Papilio machaon]
MQSMIILATALCVAQASFYAGAPAPIQLSPDGKYVLDTPEVAHAKAAHYAAHAQASTSQGAWAPAASYHGAPAYAAGAHYGAPGAAGYAAGYGKWTGPPANIQLTHDGQYVVDTPEVQHARAAHLSQYAAAAHAAASAPEEGPWNHGHGWH